MFSVTKSAINISSPSSNLLINDLSVIFFVNWRVSPDSISNKSTIPLWTPLFNFLILTSSKSAMIMISWICNIDKVIDLQVSNLVYFRLFHDRLKTFSILLFFRVYDRNFRVYRRVIVSCILLLVNRAGFEPARDLTFVCFRHLSLRCVYQFRHRFVFALNVFAQL